MRDRTWGWHGAVQVRAAASLVFFGFLACCTVWLSVGEWLFRQDSADSVRAAAARYGNTRYYQRWADLEPGRAHDALRAAASMNPSASEAWLALGLAAERAGDLVEAARDLAQAEQIDRQYLPAWTAANFYFRHTDPAQFWHSASRAAALAYDDLRPLIDLTDHVEPNTAAAITRLGDTPRLERAYLDYLIGKNRWGDAQDVALMMLARRDRDDQQRLTAFVDRLISAGQGRKALALWSGFRGNLGIPLYSGLLTNGDLKTTPSGLGFDWRIAAPSTVAVQWQPLQLRFSLGGAEPDACVLLEQWVVLAAHRYRLRFEYRTDGIRMPRGLAWSVLPREGAGTESPGLAPAENWRQADWNFAAPKAGLARLRFVYRRETGTARAQGRVALRRLRLEAL